MPRLFHLVEPEVWAAAGAEYAPPSLADEGFVHLSFADQVEGSADRHLADAPALLALEVEPDGAQVRLEDSYGSGTEYPHLYGPLSRSCVVAEHPMTRDEQGRWRLSGDASAAPASPDR